MQSVEIARLSGETIRALARRSPFRWLAAALADWLVIVAAYAVFLFCWTQGAWLWCSISGLAAVVIVGIWRHRLSILGHDGAHYLITQNRALNHLLSDFFVFWPNFLYTRNYERFHRPHHQGLSTGIDLELQHKALNPSMWTLPLSPQDFRRRIWRSAIGGNWREAMLIMEMIGPKGWRDLVGPLLWWGTAMGLLGITLGLSAALAVQVIWTLATFTSFITVFHLRMLCEHHGTTGTYRIQTHWLARLSCFPHGEDCHLEHHRYPAVPFFRLAELRRVCLAREQGRGQPLMSMAEVFQRLASISTD